MIFGAISVLYRSYSATMVPVLYSPSRRAAPHPTPRADSAANPEHKDYDNRPGREPCLRLTATNESACQHSTTVRRLVDPISSFRHGDEAGRSDPPTVPIPYFMKYSYYPLNVPSDRAMIARRCHLGNPKKKV